MTSLCPGRFTAVIGMLAVVSLLGLSERLQESPVVHAAAPITLYGRPCSATTEAAPPSKRDAAESLRFHLHRDLEPGGSARAGEKA